MSCFFNPGKRIKTRKEHVCEYCGKTIPKGTSGVLYESGAFDGELFARYACSACQPYVGDFWEHVCGECECITRDFAEFMADKHPDANIAKAGE